jgi:hypothetical protein
MKTFIFIVSCAFAFLSCLVSKQTVQDDFKIWDKTKPLEWKDFKGKCDWQGGYDAKTQWGIMTKKKDSMSMGVYAYFYKPSSCHLLGGDDLLRHEQYHFNIAELHVRRIRKELKEKNITIGSTDFANLMNKKMEECRDMQVDYDSRTNHFRLKKVQLEWQEYIDKELMKLEAFAE